VGREVSCVVKGTALPHDPAVCLLSDIHPKNNLLHTGALRQEGKKDYYFL